MAQQRPYIHERLQRIRWSLLHERDRLAAAGQQAARTRTLLVRFLLNLTVYLVSVPIYLTRSPQAGFTKYARRRGDTYVESYIGFKRTARLTVGIVIVTILATGAAIVAGTFVRKTVAPSTESSRVLHVGILKRATTLDPMVAAFKAGLAERGYRENERVLYDEQTVSGDEVALEAAADTFVDQKKDLILAVGDLAAKTAKKVTVRVNIPTVFYANFDPVESGLIESYASSKNNLVGVGEGAFVNQQLELLVRIAPAAQVIGVMSVPTDRTNQDFIRVLKTAAASDGLEVREEAVETAADIAPALERLKAVGVNAVYLAPSTLTAPRLAYVAHETLARGMLLIGNSQKNAEVGALYAVMADLDSVGEQLASQADQIFSNVLPAHLSSELPTKSLLALNLKTAATLNLTLPDDILTRADVTY